ncbi:M23 family metallopeptidase [Arthrobacter alkaliphilus]|uniref:M23 family metallopeptidase n=1 Tax=Arthrobacter alkaliphilus TaxID=369936 RepID=UPI001F3D0F78|nr:peptidoglycan DD-metalloendopeptidase family protein [Arthrobacter alkaliphilus]
MMLSRFLAGVLLLLALGTSPAVASALPGPSPGVRPDWAWPLSPTPAVLRGFDPPAKPWLSGHRGVDLRAAADGVAVAAPAGGTVSFVGVVVDRPVITIDHGGGLLSSFEPVDSELSKGAPVSKGQDIGAVRAGHCPGPPCLHWGVRRGEDYVNPLAFVTDLRPSVLLPWTSAGAGRFSDARRWRKSR